MNIVPFFLGLQNQLKLNHWMTQSFAQHTAFGATYASLDILIDRFVEVCFGAHGRDKITGDFEIKVKEFSEEGCVNVFDMYVKIINGKLREGYRENPELVNLIDEMVSELNKLKYLLTLK